MTIANTNVIAKVAAVVAGLGLVAMSFAVAPAKAATVAEIEAQIAALQAQLGSSTTSNTCVFTRDLTIGSQGADVTCLQTTLAAKGYFNVAPTGYFGPVTQGSVAKWQIAAGITPPAGYFGPISRSAFTAMGGSTGGSTGGNTGGSTGGSSLSGGEATLSDFDLRREETSGYEGEEEVEVATAEFDVEDGDVRVERLEIMASSTSTSLDMKPWNYFDRVIVWADGKEIGDMDVDNRNDWDEQGNDVYRLVVTGLDYVVDEGDKAEITFGFDINSNIDTADLQNSFDFYIEDDGIRAVEIG
ncbi:peptidoglycan-binding protein, partial [Patescibacteria group bacterium]|nr:peptidoglycan-binding protein [Patescibacteria group bacterium]MBU1754804.1 peptidoglycan-binding protein [Patescibacteria group bacterium]